MKLLIKHTQPLILIILFTFVIACKKPAGPGGKAIIKGKVYSYDFDNTYRYLISKGYISGEKVYIMYGSYDYVGNKIETAPDGSFEFRFMNKGHYKVFANSVDTSYKIKGNNTPIAVIREFDITKTGQTITLDDIIINK